GESPCQLRLCIRQVRSNPADGVVEIESDSTDPLAGGGLDDELSSRKPLPTVQPVLHDAARVVLNAAQKLHDARVGEKGRRILDVGGRRLAEEEALGPDHCSPLRRRQSRGLRFLVSSVEPTLTAGAGSSART